MPVSNTTHDGVLVSDRLSSFLDHAMRRQTAGYSLSCFIVLLFLAAEGSRADEFGSVYLRPRSDARSTTQPTPVDASTLTHQAIKSPVNPSKPASIAMPGLVIMGHPTIRSNDPANQVERSPMVLSQRPIGASTQGWNKFRSKIADNDPEALKRPDLVQATYQQPGPNFGGPNPFQPGSNQVLPNSMGNPGLVTPIMQGPPVMQGPQGSAVMPNVPMGQGPPMLQGPSGPLPSVLPQNVPPNSMGIPSPSDASNLPRYNRPPRVVSGEPWVTEGPCAYDAYEMVVPANFQQYPVCGGPSIVPGAPPPATAGVPYAWAPPAVLPNAAPGLYSSNNSGFRPLFSLGQENYNVQIGRGIIGQPTTYVQGQPLRNFLRYLFP